MEIDKAEEFTKDWDWFAVDQNGSIGHFTSAGLHPLPKSVKDDVDALTRLTQYFSKELCPSSDFVVTDTALRHIPQPADSDSRRRFLSSFIAIAAKGIFSYNSEMTRELNSGYYLVAKPLDRLTIVDIPPNVAALLQRTRAPLTFDN